MKVERMDTGAVSVLCLNGDLDEGGVGELQTALYECFTQERLNLVLNLAEVRFISYLGVGVLVERLRKVRALGGDIKIVGMNLYAERLFRMVGVGSLFETFDSEAQAIGVFQAAA
jgi:anti-sigma B factor antagonist